MVGSCLTVAAGAGVAGGVLLWLDWSRNPSLEGSFVCPTFALIPQTRFAQRTGVIRNLKESKMEQRGRGRGEVLIGRRFANKNHDLLTRTIFVT